MSDKWLDDAWCRDRHVSFWFPPEEVPKNEWRYYYDVARLVCDICPVRKECARAGADEVHGMWAGQLPTDRKAGRETPRPRKAISEADVMLRVPRHTSEPIADIKVVRQVLLDVAKPRFSKK